MEQIRSADVLASFPQVDEEKLNAALAAEAAASNRKIIVLDDDPTGVQTVHDIYVYTDWTVESLRKGFAAPEKLFFILTNSRGFTVAETTKAHREDRGEHRQGGPRVRHGLPYHQPRRLHPARPLPAGDRPAARGDGG